MTVKWRGQEIAAKVRAAAMRGVVRGTENVRNEAIRLVLSPPKTGRIYRRRGVEHQASGPGEAPASDLGRLVNSIITSYRVPELTGIVSARTAYAAALEFGTARLEPRPYMRPALLTKKDEIEADIAREIREALGA